MLVTLLTLWLGVSAGIGAVVFAASWLAWTHRADSYAKPGGPLTCRTAQSTLFALLAAACWWIAPVAVVLLLARYYCRWDHDRMPARSYNLAQILAAESRRLMQ